MPEETETKFKLENLVVMKFIRENTYIKIMPAFEALKEDKNLSIENNQWKYFFEGTLNPNIVLGIGQSFMYFPPGFKEGVIGVYDKTIEEHSKSMAMAYKQTIRCLGNPNLF